jgi:alkaline phosphatase
LFGAKKLFPGPDSKVSDIDGQPYTTILYGNGPGYATPRIVPMNTTTASDDRNQVHGSAVPRQWATHGGEDVPVYALGPLATTLFTGTFDQSYIPHAVAYSACLGEHRLRCQGIDNYTAPQVTTCVAPEVSSVSAAGAPVVIASSVMADDGTRAKSGAGVFVPVTHLLCLVMLEFAVT